MKPHGSPGVETSAWRVTIFGALLIFIWIHGGKTNSGAIRGFRHVIICLSPIFERQSGTSMGL
jgi:hypothetical protein